MKTPTQKKIIWYECIGFTVIIVFLWIDEIVDIPHMIFGAPQTPINWQESLFETVLVSILAAIIIKFSENCIKEIKYLQEITVICTLCKRIKSGDRWITQVAPADKSSIVHGICPECAQKENCGNLPQ